MTSESPTHQNTLPQTKMEMKSDSYGSITSLATTVDKSPSLINSLKADVIWKTDQESGLQLDEKRTLIEAMNASI